MMSSNRPEHEEDFVWVAEHCWFVRHGLDAALKVKDATQRLLERVRDAQRRQSLLHPVVARPASLIESALLVYGEVGDLTGEVFLSANLVWPPDVGFGVGRTSLLRWRRQLVDESVESLLGEPPTPFVIERETPTTRVGWADLLTSPDRTVVWPDDIRRPVMAVVLDETGLIVAAAYDGTRCGANFLREVPFLPKTWPEGTYPGNGRR